MGMQMIFRVFAVLFLALGVIGSANAGYVGNDPMNYTDPTGMERAIGCEPLCTSQDLSDGGYYDNDDPLSFLIDSERERLPAITDREGENFGNPAPVDNSRNIWELATNDAADTWYEVPVVAAQEMVQVCFGGACGGISAPARVAPLAVADEAGVVANLLRKNSVQIPTATGALRYDLVGAAHKGVATPHVQTLVYNLNRVTGQVHLNKVSSAVRPMTKKDLDTVVKHVAKNGG